MKKGFTLVEMIVIVCIIAVLSLLSAPSIIETIRSGNKQVCLDNQKAILSEYYAKSPYTDNKETLFKQIIIEYGEICPNGTIIAITAPGHLNCPLHGSASN